ncbi:MAG: metallophosphoesterase, partial [Planctomycetota bacterium]
FASFDTVLAIYRQLKMPKYHVLGNHDFPAEHEHAEVMEKLGMARPYYDFGLKGWRFIILDGNDISLQACSRTSLQYKQAKALLNKMESDGLVNTKKCNGAIDSEQIRWLKKTLKAACDTQEKVIICCHFPIWPQGKLNLWNDTEMLGVIEPYDCLKAYINGHVHKGGYGLRNGIHYLTIEGMLDTPDTNAYAVIEVYPDFLKVAGFGRVPERILEIR